MDPIVHKIHKLVQDYYEQNVLHYYAQVDKKMKKGLIINRDHNIMKEIYFHNKHIQYILT